jgi:hypothetical protein
MPGLKSGPISEATAQYRGSKSKTDPSDCSSSSDAAFSADGAFSAAGAFLHDGGVEALAEFGGKLVDLMLAVDGDGLTGGVEDDFAVVALADMSLDLREEVGVDFAVEVVGELGEEIGAGHGFGLPFFCLK